MEILTGLTSVKRLVVTFLAALAMLLILFCAGATAVVMDVVYSSPSGTINQNNPVVEAIISYPDGTASQLSGTMTLNGQSLPATSCTIDKSFGFYWPDHHAFRCATSNLNPGAYDVVVNVADGAGFNDVATGQFSVGNATSGKPQLSIRKDSIFWGSFSEYQARHLSVRYIITDLAYNAFDVKITGSDSSGGVTVDSPLPLNLGTITTLSSASATLVYNIPSGTTSFTANMNAQASNESFQTFTYP